jgi:hypothetical protein
MCTNAVLILFFSMTVRKMSFSYNIFREKINSKLCNLRNYLDFFSFIMIIEGFLNIFSDKIDIELTGIEFF